MALGDSMRVTGKSVTGLSTCCTAHAALTPPRTAGWRGKGNGASLSNSTVSSWARRPRASQSARVTWMRLRGIRFVVTADADTTLPPGSVSRLVGALAHPLNSACVDQVTGRFRTGYTVVQPRVEISPESGNRSLFARLYAGDTAVPTSTAAPFLTSIRISSAKASMSARGSTKSPPSTRASRGEYPRMLWSVTISSKDYTDALRWRATLSSMRISRPAMSSTPAAGTGGYAVTGSSCRGSLAGCPAPAIDVSRPDCQHSIAGRSSTIFAEA